MSEYYDQMSQMDINDLPQGMHIYDAYEAGMASADELFDPSYDDEQQATYEGPILTEWDNHFNAKIKQMYKDGGPISKEHEEKLAKQIAAGSIDARNELVLAHSTFAAWYVRESMGFHKTLGTKPKHISYGGGLINGMAASQLEYADRLQIAHEAMIKAAEGYVNADTKFITKAKKSIENATRRAVDDYYSLFKVPAHMNDQVASIKNAISKRSNKDSLPTDTEILAGAEVPSGLGVCLDLHTRMQPISYEVLQAFFADKAAAATYASFDKTDPIEVLDAVQPEDYCNDENESDFLLGTYNDISALSFVRGSLFRIRDDRSRDIIISRFGLIDGEPMTLDEVGQEYGLSRERIRQIEAQTLSRLRHSPFYPDLNRYIAKDYDDGICSFTGLRGQIPITEDELLSLGVEPKIRYTIDKTEPKA